MIFRQGGQPDQVVPLVTPYTRAACQDRTGRRTWAYAEQEGERPVFRPTDEINLG
jgi:hypothetical protein